VLLPEPDGPITAVKLPLGSARDTPRRACTDRLPAAYVLVIPATCRAYGETAGASLVDASAVRLVVVVLNSKPPSWRESRT